VINKKRLLIALGIALLLIGSTLSIILLQMSQENRSNAQKATTISFNTPLSAPSQAITLRPGQTFSLPIFVNPGINFLTTIRYVFSYDPKIFTVLPDQYSYNTAVFSTDFKKANIEGPFYSPLGQISGTLTIGDKVDSLIKSPTQIASFTFQVATNPAILKTPSTISFLTGTDQTQLFSAGPTDQAVENVLSSAIPATYTFEQPTPIPTNTPIPTPTSTPIPTPTSTPRPTPTNTPTPTATPTPMPTNTPVPTNTPIPQATLVSLDITLHAIGAGGDNSNQTGGGGNQNPMHPQRDLTVQIINTSNQLVLEKTGKITLNPSTGHLMGTIDLGTSLQTGTYIVKVKSPFYLRRQAKVLQTITSGQANTITPFTLIAADIDNNDQIDLFDYQILSNCYSDFTTANPTTCSPDQKIAADINDDGKVNFIDLNYFIRELAVQAGDTL
jgi:hypothetical protein